MNFLGHAVLSTTNAGNIAGNIAGDFFPGIVDKINTTTDIKTGILLHRKIDSFTDANPHVWKANKIFHADFGKYAPVITDILWDYYFAHDTQLFINPAALSKFAADIYAKISTQLAFLPERFQPIFLNMQTNDWLSGYYYKERIMNALNHLSKRAKYWPGDFHKIEQIWQANHNLLSTQYLLLKNDLINEGILSNPKMQIHF